MKEKNKQTDKILMDRIEFAIEKFQDELAPKITNILSELMNLKIKDFRKVSDLQGYRKFLEEELRIVEELLNKIQRVENVSWSIKHCLALYKEFLKEELAWIKIEENLRKALD